MANVMTSNIADGLSLGMLVPNSRDRHEKW